MPRVSEVLDEGSDETLGKVFAVERKLFGDVINPTKVMAHCPPILAAAKQMNQAFEKSNRLPGALRSLVYLRVATINGCPF